MNIGGPILLSLKRALKREQPIIVKPPPPVYVAIPTPRPAIAPPAPAVAKVTVKTWPVLAAFLIGIFVGRELSKKEKERR